MHSIWSFFTYKRNFTYLLLVALVVAGLFSLGTIQKESNPEVQIPIGMVSTALPGASAADVETLVTNEIESALSGTLEDVNKITSVSSNGVSSITVEFDADANIDDSIQELKDQVDTAVPDLPDEATDPRVMKLDFSQQPVLTFAVSGDLAPSEFTHLADALEDELERIQGVSSVTTAGAQAHEVQVVVNREALRTYNISLTDVTSAIRRSNAQLPIGAIEFDGIAYNLQFEADIQEPSEVADVVVMTIEGQPITVRDVAFVSDGLSKTTSLSRVSVDGEPSRPALSFNVQKQAGANVTDLTTAVNERLATLQQQDELLDDMDVVVMFDTGEFLIRDLTTLTQSGIVAVLLVMGILFITIGWREALVAGLSIPLSFMIAFVGLLLSGNTLNFISLFSLILSVGILVDSAIVVVEGIHSNMRQWMDKTEAALKTIRDFHTPITAGTMTTVAVFVPLFFISGIVGEFIKSIPFTIISILFASLIVALGFIPMVASIVLRRRMTSTLEERQEVYTEHALARYKRGLSSLLGNPFRENAFLALVVALFFATPLLPIKGVPAALLFGIGVGIVLFFMLQRNVRWRYFIPATLGILAVMGTAVSFLPSALTMQVEFFPSTDEDYLIVEMELPEGTVLDRSEIEARRIEEILYTDPTIESFVMTVGASSAFTGTGGSSGSKFANAFIQLDPERERTSGELAGDLSDRFSEIKTSDIRVTQLAGGPPVGTPVVIQFKGDDLDQLKSLAREAARILESIEGTNAVTTSARNDSTEFVLNIDKTKAAAVGLEPQIIAQTLRTAVEGSEATTIKTPSEDIDVVVKMALDPEYRDPHATNEVTIEAIRDLEIMTQNGPVILGSVLETEVRQGNTAIRHEDEQRVATAESQLAAGGNVAEINQEFARRAADELDVPENVEMIIGGENEETTQSFMEMGYAIIAGLVLMFAIVVLMFNSFRHAVYVLAPAFFSFIGISIGLTITGNALSFPALMGLIALVGIVVNNSIILIDVMNKLRMENPDRDIEEVILEGASSRLRPILLTTLTTVIGITPLLFTASFWAPLALAIIFGLTFSVIITLIMIPIIYHRNPGEMPQ